MDGDFREYVRQTLARRQAVDPTFTSTKVAKKMRIQRSYLSNVLNGRGSLTQDQAYLFSRAVGLSASEEHYLSLLLELDRSVVEERKREIIELLKAINLPKDSSGNRMKSAGVNVSEEAVAKYYSDPHYPICHMYLCIDEYANDPWSLAAKVGLSRDKLSEIFEVLEQCRVIERGTMGIKMLQDNVFLAREKPFAKTHALLFRLKAVDAFNHGKDPEGYFFTASFAATEALRLKLKEAWLRMLQEISGEIVDCEATDVYHLNLDLFRM